MKLHPYPTDLTVAQKEKAEIAEMLMNAVSIIDNLLMHWWTIGYEDDDDLDDAFQRELTSAAYDEDARKMWSKACALAEEVDGRDRSSWSHINTWRPLKKKHRRINLSSELDNPAGGG